MRTPRCVVAAAVLAAALGAARAAGPAGAPVDPRDSETEDDSQIAPIPQGAGAQAEGRNIAGPGDYSIREKVLRALTRDPELSGGTFRLIMVNGGAVFSGEIATCARKTRALRTAASVRGVINVTDEMRVPASGAGDGELRRAVGGLLAGAEGELGLRDLEVTSEGGVVTLAGTVKDFAARIRAEDLAGTVAGVSRIANRMRAADAPSGTDDATLTRALIGYLGDYRQYPYPAEIQVRVRDGVATLTGRSNLFIGRVLAGNMAMQVKGIDRVDNRIRTDPSLGPLRTTVRPAP